MNQNVIIAGVDEVGRGPLVGSVVAAAVVLGANHGIVGLADSKKLSEKRRQSLDIEIREKAVSWAIAESTAKEIDEINILQATFLAMRRAIDALNVKPNTVLVDGNTCPEKNPGYHCEAIIKGDQKIEEISAASIIAKVYRDQQMVDLHAEHPDYGFASHKGYPTKVHLAALVKLGAIREHRRSFAPVRNVL